MGSEMCIRDRNGAGKSNFLAVLRFLKDSLTPPRGHNTTSFMYAVSAERLGWTRALDIAIKKPSPIKFQYSFEDERLGGHNVLDISLWISGYNVLLNEEVLTNQRPDHPNFEFYESNGGGNEIIHTFLEGNSIRNGLLGGLGRRDELLLFNIDNLLEHSSSAPENIPLFTVRREILETIETWHFYNANHMDLGEIRRSEPRISRQDRYLNEDGTNLAVVFHNLRNDDRYFEQQFSEAMKMILPKTDMIRHYPVGSQSLSIEWSFEGVDEALILSDLSDGTVRMLCWAVVLLSPKLPALLVIEEPEVGLHPAWMKVLATWIKRAAEHTQIIITTHSPDLLDQFTDRIEDVAVFEPVPGDDFHYTINRLDKEALSQWFERDWELGDMYRMGHPLVGGWP